MDISDYRQKIDEIDKEIVRLFSERMETAAGIAQWKRENGKPVLDAARESQKLDAVAALVPQEMEEYTRELYKFLFELSRSYQKKLNGE